MAKEIKPLRMIAADTDDITVLSACFQDAVAKMGDMTFLPKQRRFALVANRFVWEDGVKKNFGPFTRVRSGVHFDDVLKVQSKNLRRDAASAVVSILAVKFEPGTDGAGVVSITFAGGGEIRLHVESINAEMRDISAPWRTQNKPDHRLE